jgi:hypothetical protein
VTAVGAVGADAERERLREIIADIGASTDHLIEAQRTVTKTRVRAGGVREPPIAGHVDTGRLHPSLRALAGADQ